MGGTWPDGGRRHVGFESRPVVMPTVKNNRKVDHVFGNARELGDGIFDSVTVPPGMSVELSDAELKRMDGVAFRAMVATGELSLDAPAAVAAAVAAPAAVEAKKESAEADELMRNLAKGKR